MLGRRCPPLRPGTGSDAYGWVEVSWGWLKETVTLLLDHMVEVLRAGCRFSILVSGYLRRVAQIEVGGRQLVQRRREDAAMSEAEASADKAGKSKGGPDAQSMPVLNADPRTIATRLIPTKRPETLHQSHRVDPIVGSSVLSDLHPT